MPKLLTLVQKRQSSQFLFAPKRKVSKKDLQKTVKAARRAPTARNMHHLEIVVVDDKKLLKEIAELHNPVYRRDGPLYLALFGMNAPVDILVYTSEEVREWSAVPRAFAMTALRGGKFYMKEKAGVVRGWLRKAASDVVTLEATLAAGAFDGACFHAQQAAEEYPRGFLTFHDRPFPYTHNFGRPYRTLRRDCTGVSHAHTLSCRVDTVCGSTAVR